MYCCHLYACFWRHCPLAVVIVPLGKFLKVVVTCALFTHSSDSYLHL